MMEGDYHVGQVLDTLKELNIDTNTILVFCSDNGPSGWILRELGNLGSPDMGNAGPFRGELGEATEGSLRTFCFVRWPGHMRRAVHPTPCSRKWISCRLSRPSSVPSCRRIARSTAWTRPRCFSARARRGAQIAAHLHRPGFGGCALEAMALLLQGHASDRHRAANARRHLYQQWSIVFPEGL